MTNAEKLATEIVNLQHKKDCLRCAQTSLNLAGYPGETRKADHYINRTIADLGIAITMTQKTLDDIL